MTKYLRSIAFERYLALKRKVITKKEELPKISKELDITLPLHVYIFHDIFVDANKIESRINFTELLNKNNIMLVIYDNNSQIISKPALATNYNINTIMINYVKISEKYMLSSNVSLEELLKNKKFIHDDLDLTKYKGDVILHQLN